MKEKLPDYMIPSQLIEIESIPLTPNGKLDKRALPDPDAGELLNGEYAEAGNEAEKVLTEIWKELLDIDKVGIHDNFFELGGDSIVTIQMVSRARRSGYELQVGDVFTYQTISRLSVLLEQRSDKQFDESGEQSVLGGECGLLPIQQWYLEKDPKEVSYFNQSVLLEIDKGVSEPVLKRAVEQLMSHHDALRFKYYKKEGQWHQVYGAESEISEVNVVDLQSTEKDLLINQISENAVRYQRSLDIEKGEMMRVVLMQTPKDETHNRLLLVIHHLAIDGVSWRILLEDLEILVSGLNEGGKTDLGRKSSSYRQWYETLQEYGKSDRLISQKGYWEKAVKDQVSLPQDKDHTKDIKIKDTTNHMMRLSEEKTRRLIQEVPRVYHTEINDILLSALAKTLCQWTGNDKAVIEMEGHGREAIGNANEEADKADTSRTVGWFTTHYPVLLEINPNKGEDDLIKTVKEQLRQIPDKGIGYGVLKYINKEETLQDLPGPDIIFNYLGQADNVLSSGKWFGLASESAGQSVSNEYRVSNKLSVSGFIQSGELILNWGYSKLHFENETIKDLVEKFKINLESLIEHCAEQEKTGVVFTPSDFGLGSEISYTELDTFLNEKINSKARKESIEGLYRLSGLQQGMMFHGLYDEEGADTYIRQLSCELTGIDFEILKKSWESVLKRHTILRSAFYHDVLSIPVQCVYKEVNLPVEVLDYRDKTKEEQTEALKEYKEANRLKSFDFKTAPLMRIGLIRLSEDKYQMVWTWHHILFDGWSMQILMEEFLNTYELLISGKQPAETDADRYEDYIRYIDRGDKDAEETYWRNYMKDVEQSTYLPFIGTTTERNRGSGLYETVSLQFDNVVTDRIQNYAKQHGITFSTLVQGIWAYLLHRYTGSDDITFGVIVSGRPDDLQNVEKRVGMFINSLPLRSQMKKGEDINKWLSGLQNDQILSRKHQYTPLHKIQGWTRLKSDLFDSLLVFENYPIRNLSTRNGSLQVGEIEIMEQTNFPLTLAIDNSEQINISFRYNTSLLEEAYVREISNNFENVMLQMIDESVRTHSDIELLTPSMKRLLLEEFNNTKVDYPKDKFVINLFEEQVIKTPDNTAVVFEDEKLTYRELNEKSNRLGHYLRGKGVKEDTPVPIFLERSIEMIIGILGILKAGGAYVPIDPEYPEERAAYMLDDTEAFIVVSSKESSSKLSAIKNIDIVEVNGDWSKINECSKENLMIPIAGNNLAYIIYTSGSTGKPKGVMIEHGALINRLNWAQDYYGLTAEDSVLQKTTICFDVSVWELLWPLLAGSKLVFAKPGGQKDTSYLKSIIETERITMIHFVPSMLEIFLTDLQKGECLSLRKVLCSGEALKPSQAKLFREILPQAELHNLYGPTEAAIDVTYWSPDNDPEKDIKLVPIGKPVSNTRIYILDDNGLVPIGGIGEIHIGGIQVARGYLNMPDLTAEKFVEDNFNFNKESGSRMYKTGDLGRWLPDGNIEYIGRKDNQVKINGNRIELGEIENVLLQSNLVNQSVVCAISNSDGNKHLVGYVVVKDVFDKEAVISYLQSRLPEYMVPYLWHQLESMPLTQNGKIDRKALPQPDARESLNNEYVPPHNDLEEKLSAVWQELLHVERVGIHDNFFELGGDSIITMQVVGRVQRMGYELKPKDIFIHQTINKLSAVLSGQSESVVTGEQGLLTGECGLLPIQQWFLDEEDESRSHFNQAILLSIDKSVSSPVLRTAVEELLSHHDALRFRYMQEDGQWRQEYGEADAGKTFFTVDLQTAEKNSFERLIKEQADNYQQSLDIEKGELVRVLLIQTPAWEQHNRVLFVIHHLAIDGVSWRILLEDLELLLTGFLKNGNAKLEKKSSSYRQWYEALKEYGQSGRLLLQIPYWEKAESSYDPLPVDKTYNDAVLVKDIDLMSMRLDTMNTQLLLQEVPRTYHTQVNDILLCALSLTLCEWCSGKKITIGLEGHGRENISDGIDTSRTIGWFTSLYPVLLEVNPDKDVSNAIKSVKEQLRLVPDRGLGYGVLKYINRKDSFQGHEPWDIVFNYLGQLDNIISGGKWFSTATESRGSASSGEHKLGYNLSVNGMVQGGELILNWGYSTRHYDRQTIEQLMEKYQTVLESLITHCIEQQKSGAVYTPSDYGLESEVSYEELDQFLQADDKDNIMSF